MLLVRLRKMKNTGQKQLELLLMICIHTSENVRHFQKKFFGQIAKGKFKHKKFPHLARMKVQKPNSRKRKVIISERSTLSEAPGVLGEHGEEISSPRAPETILSRQPELCS